MSGMPAPAVAPHSPVVRPEVVQPRPKKPNHRGIWIVLILTIAAILGGVAIWRKIQPAASTPQTTAAISAIRTAKVVSGPVEQTLRITGVTAAANYASLVTPNLRGSRTDYGRDSSTLATSSTTSSSAVFIQFHQLLRLVDYIV